MRRVSATLGAAVAAHHLASPPAHCSTWGQWFGRGGESKPPASERAKSAVRRVVVASAAANDPCEDRVVVVEQPGQHVLAAVMDGHGGWQVAEFVHQRLAGAVNRALELEKQGQRESGSEFESVPRALVAAFEDLDQQWVEAVQGAFRAGIGAVAAIGACCLCVVVTPDVVVCANAGDCRAVLGRKAATLGLSSYEAVPLSRDHNAREPEEQALLAKAHPGEPDVVVSRREGLCYVKGRLQPTRAFGDLYLKLADFNGPPYTREAMNQNGARGVHVPEPFTPPYITAAPETKLRPRTESDAFVVIGSDGLWDYMDNSEVVQFVARQTALGPDAEADVAQKLIDEVLGRAAKDVSMSLDQLRNLAPGQQRRITHDDVTVVVVFL